MLNLIKIIDQRLLLMDDKWNSNNIEFIKNLSDRTTKNGYNIDVVKDFSEIKTGNKIKGKSETHKITNKERSYA